MATFSKCSPDPTAGMSSAQPILQKHQEPYSSEDYTRWIELDFQFFVVTFFSELLKIKRLDVNVNISTKVFAYPSPLKFHKTLKTYYHN